MQRPTVLQLCGSMDPALISNSILACCQNVGHGKVLGLRGEGKNQSQNSLSWLIFRRQSTVCELTAACTGLLVQYSLWLGKVTQALFDEGMNRPW